MRCLSVILFVLAFHRFETNGRSLPNFITRCKKHDPQISQCLINAVEQIRPHFKEGIPEMHILSFHPLKIKSVNLDVGNSLNAIFENIDVYGLPDCKANDAIFDFNNKLLEVDIDCNEVFVKADYKLKGQFSFLVLDGEGKGNLSLKHANVTAKLFGRTIITEGKKYLHFDKIDLDLTLKVNSILFDDVFKDNPELSATFSKIIKNNLDSIILDIQPTLEDSFKGIMLELLNNILTRYTIDELFIDD